MGLLAAMCLLNVPGLALARTATPPESGQVTNEGPPSADEINRALNKAHKAYLNEKGGKNADYIPVLAKVDPKLFGIAVVTVDGRAYQVGDSGHAFSIQSIAKVFTAAKVMDALGTDAVEKKIGVNATGMPFNSIIAIETNEKHRAGNPLVNPGAITAVSLVPGADANTRWASIIGTMNAAAGHSLNVDQEVYKSESETNTRNQAISKLLQAYEVLGADPAQTLDLYTRECSVSVTAKDLAAMGATLANGGVNPITGARMVSPDVSTKTLAVMQTNGLYENSGQWAYEVGVPAKSGVGGGILAVIPGRYAIGTFSTPLDDAGNSVRGQKAIASIVKDLKGNVFDTGQPHHRLEAKQTPKP